MSRDGKGKGGLQGRMGCFPHAQYLDGLPFSSRTSAGWPTYISICNGPRSSEMCRNVSSLIQVRRYVSSTLANVVPL
jgi:hypothetical protein